MRNQALIGTLVLNGVVRKLEHSLDGLKGFNLGEIDAADDTLGPVVARKIFEFAFKLADGCAVDEEAFAGVGNFLLVSAHVFHGPAGQNGLVGNLFHFCNVREIAACIHASRVI